MRTCGLVLLVILAALGACMGFMLGYGVAVLVFYTPAWVWVLAVVTCGLAALGVM